MRRTVICQTNAPGRPPMAPPPVRAGQRSRGARPRRPRPALPQASSTGTKIARGNRAAPAGRRAPRTPSRPRADPRPAHGRPLAREHDVAGRMPAARGRAGRLLDEQATRGLRVTALARARRPHPQPEASARGGSRLRPPRLPRARLRRASRAAWRDPRSRQTSSSTSRPGFTDATVAGRAPAESTSRPSEGQDDVTLLHAGGRRGPSGSTLATSAARGGRGRRTSRAPGQLLDCRRRGGRGSRPCACSWRPTSIARRSGWRTRRLVAARAAVICELMPTTSPRRLNSGPPECPIHRDGRSG